MPQCSVYSLHSQISLTSHLAQVIIAVRVPITTASKTTPSVLCVLHIQAGISNPTRTVDIARTPTTSAS